ncbi:hypothetical protein [Carboxylicivirga sp. N1Y90]|uniref:hypothetical protein n=1 Tax=Carboxylicivirga fragile TaxID=3417571 RepID=UPI003D3341C7|nr:hypothetical protein [Marinilabiliaceae bacterium N1Y90]
MSQAKRILLYYLIILGLAYALIKLIPINFQPATWQLTKSDAIIGTATDSIEALDTIALSFEKPDSLVVNDSIPLVKDTIVSSDFLSYPTAFHTQLKKLKKALAESVQNNEVIRILHFGDSQIEGDRITAYLREAFQEKYGGSGPGLISILDLQRLNPSVWLEHSKSWRLHSIYAKPKQDSINRFGLMGQTALLPPNTRAFFKMSRSPWAESHASNYQQIRLFIAPHADSILINGSIKSTEIINDTLGRSDELTEINWTFPEPSPSLKIYLESKTQLNILACALDSTSGVAVDNIALRGQNTPLLQHTDGELFQAMGEHLNIGMVIFQYGTNMVPVKRKQYGFYKKILTQQFELLQQYIPNVPVLVVGISDAAFNKDGKTESYKHLTKIRDAQKETAHKYGFAFFDLYEAMGGEGAIIDWSNQSPPLALTDYIHFTRLGGKHAAELINKSLITELDKIKSIESIPLIMRIDSTSWNNY